MLYKLSLLSVAPATTVYEDADGESRDEGPDGEVRGANGDGDGESRMNVRLGAFQFFHTFDHQGENGTNIQEFSTL